MQDSKLPKKIQAKLDAYLKRVKKIRWFKLSPDFTTLKAEKQIRLALKAFGVEAEVEWKRLETRDDWDAACGAAWGAAWNVAWNVAWNAAWDAAWDAARGAARGAAEIVAIDLEGFNKKYPDGAFLLLIPLWEMGLYPCGVIDGKFVVYKPE